MKRNTNICKRALPTQPNNFATEFHWSRCRKKATQPTIPKLFLRCSNTASKAFSE